jgi:hypothetical protein
MGARTSIRHGSTFNVAVHQRAHHGRLDEAVVIVWYATRLPSPNLLARRDQILIPFYSGYYLVPTKWRVIESASLLTEIALASITASCRSWHEKSR